MNDKDKKEFSKKLQDGLVLSIAQGVDFDDSYLIGWIESKKEEWQREAREEAIREFAPMAYELGSEHENKAYYMQPYEASELDDLIEEYLTSPDNDDE